MDVHMLHVGQLCKDLLNNLINSYSNCHRLHLGFRELDCFIPCYSKSLNSTLVLTTADHR